MEGCIAMMSGRRKVPRMGGAVEGFSFNEGEAKEYIQRPASLAGVANAFAIYVDGVSMEPRYFAGETLYVNPNKPVAPRCFVFVELADGRGIIAQFLGLDRRCILLRQFNPDRTIKVTSAGQGGIIMFTEGVAKRIHRIVGTAE